MEVWFREKKPKTQTASPVIVDSFMFSSEGRQLAAELEKLGVQVDIIEKVPCG